MECGIVVVDYGVDVIYIGVFCFGVCVVVGNLLEDIVELVWYVYVYNVCIYVMVNMILKDEELKDMEKMIWDLYCVGVDVLIV